MDWDCFNNLEDFGDDDDQEANDDEQYDENQNQNVEIQEGILDPDFAKFYHENIGNTPHQGFWII